MSDNFEVMADSRAQKLHALSNVIEAAMLL